MIEYDSSANQIAAFTFRKSRILPIKDNIRNQSISTKTLINKIMLQIDMLMIRHSKRH